MNYQGAHFRIHQGANFRIWEGMREQMCRTYSFNNKRFRMVSRDWVLDPSCVDK